MRALLALLFVATAFAGCAGSSDDLAVGLDGDEALRAFDAPLWSEPILIDTVRAGGEPVIAITQEGTILVAAHPGATHYHPSEDPAHVGTEFVTPINGQSYLWRSTDGGETWSHIGLPMLEQGPRGTAFGVSDPEFTVMADNTICYTDLEALASSSVACSTDDGQTWLIGNPVAAGGVNDRQWLASYGDELYFTANYFVDHHIRASKDRGLTWEDRGDVPCSQDLVANPHNGHLIVACGAGIAVSEDAGWTWSEPRTAGMGGGQRIMAEPAIDAAGNVWVVYTSGEHAIGAVGTPDEGLTWPYHIDLTESFRAAAGDLHRCDVLDNGAVVCEADSEPGQPSVSVSGTDDRGTYIWPWISAGSDGRFAVSWIGAFEQVDSTEHTGAWFVFSAFVYDATTQPRTHVAQLTPTPMHVGPICQSGTTCQVDSMQGNDAGDRRLGDFFETTIDAEGYLHGSWSNTMAQRNDVISHPEYVRQVGGEPLLVPEDLGVWFPTQG